MLFACCLKLVVGGLRFSTLACSSCDGCRDNPEVELLLQKFFAGSREQGGGCCPVEIAETEKAGPESPADRICRGRVGQAFLLWGSVGSLTGSQYISLSKDDAASGLEQNQLPSGSNQYMASRTSLNPR